MSRKMEGPNGVQVWLPNTSKCVKLVKLMIQFLLWKISNYASLELTEVQTYSKFFLKQLLISRKNLFKSFRKRQIVKLLRWLVVEQGLLKSAKMSHWLNAKKFTPEPQNKSKKPKGIVFVMMAPKLKLALTSKTKITKILMCNLHLDKYITWITSNNSFVTFIHFVKCALESNRTNP